MFGQLFEVRRPMRIYGPIQIAEPAHPLEKFLARLSFFGFGRPVDHHDSRSLFHQLVELVQMLVQHVTSVPCAKDDNRGRVVQDGRVLWVAVVRHQDRIHIESRMVERLGKDHVAGAMFMLQPSVAGRAGDEDDLRFVSAASVVGLSRADEVSTQKSCQA